MDIGRDCPGNDRELKRRAEPATEARGKSHDVDPSIEPATSSDADYEIKPSLSQRNGTTPGASYGPIKQKIKNRLKRIEGQVRGVTRMIDEERRCVEVLTQTAAISESLRQVILMISECHAKGCITRCVKEGHGDEAIEELINLLFKYTR